MDSVMSTSLLTTTTDDGLAHLRWHRPEAANAFNEELVEELLDSLERLAANPPAVVAFTGGGRRFCAGFDLSGASSDHELGWRFMRAEALLAAVRAFPAVTVACVAGPAFGLGADLVAACDYRIGDSGARFRFPGPRFGIVLGTHQLAARIGAAHATDVLLRNAVINVDDARRWGLLTHSVEPDDWQGFLADLVADTADLDAPTRRQLLEILRPAFADSSVAAIGRSAHCAGLAQRIETYRAATMIRTDRAGDR